ncbi:MAG: lysine N(6)-hydroxylase/L-ornithine N(5)-oxygenase family protein [Proteobacteria bacterium]|nr:lysine N(6)-hydroxylase/L-ornithine N(5)-oxygenase family protein [Pseudomonadota bacterium]
MITDQISFKAGMLDDRISDPPSPESFLNSSDRIYRINMIIFRPFRKIGPKNTYLLIAAFAMFCNSSV